MPNFLSIVREHILYKLGMGLKDIETDDCVVEVFVAGVDFLEVHAVFETD